MKLRLVAVALGLWILLGLVSPASAQTPADGAGAGAAVGAAGLDPNRCNGDPPDAPPTTVALPGLQADEPDDMEEGVCDALLDNFIPGPDPGPYPTSHYDIGFDQGGNCVCASRRVTGWLTEFFFSGQRAFVGVGLRIVNWVLSFPLADTLQGPAQAMSDAYRYRIIGPMNLGSLFLTFSALWAGFLAFTGRLGRGVAEMGTSLLIGALATTLLASPATTLLGMLRFASGLSLEVAAVSSGQPPSSNHSVAHPMTSAIHEAFIERPHQLINWGRLIPPGDPCRPTYDAAVASGPWGTSSKPRVAMKEAGCKREDRFNRDPTLGRLGLSFITVLGGALVMILLILAAATFLGAQMGVLIAIVGASVGLLFGTLPGRGRALFWRWVGSAGAALAGVVMMAVVLSLTLVAIDAVLTASSGLSVGAQMLLVDLVVVMAIVKRNRLIHAGRRATTNFAQRMSGAGGARSGSWVRPAAEGAAIGWVGGQMIDRAQSLHRHRKSSRSDRGQRAEQWQANHEPPATRRQLDADAANGDSGRPTQAGAANGDRPTQADRTQMLSELVELLGPNKSGRNGTGDEKRPVPPLAEHERRQAAAFARPTG